MYSISYYKTVKDLPTHWDAMLLENNCLHSSQLGVVENCKVNDVTPYYITVKKNDEIAMLLYAQMLQVKPYHVQPAVQNKIVEHLAKTVTKIFPLRLLVIGNLFRHDGMHCFVKPNTFNAEELGYVYDDVIQLLQKDTCCLATLVKDTNNFQIKYFEQKGYTQYQNDISMQMNLPADWQTLNDYEKALKHKYSQRMRKMQKPFTNVSIKEFDINEVEKYKTDIEKLYLQVAQKQSITLGLLNANYFVELKKSLQDRYKVYGMFYEEKIIAFTSAIVNGDYDMNYIGFDYAYNNNLNLYFNILFHCVSEAIKHNCKKLILGRTALEAKAVLGCEAVYLKSMYKINNSLLAYLTEKFTNSSVNEQGEKWKDRHPFKLVVS